VLVALSAAFFFSDQGDVISRANVPPWKVTSIIDSSPYEPLIGWNDERKQLVTVYSGLLADSVAPAGEIVITEVPVPSAAVSAASTEVEPYDA
jgi:hypothetical protein